MIDNKTKIFYLERIFSSPGFQKAKRFKELLSYLVEAEIEGKSVKESTIAIELFNKDESFDPSEDTIVRVSIGNIRRRLAFYYFSEGASDAVRIDIPKGVYSVVFSKVKPKKRMHWNPLRRYLFYFQLILIGFFIIVIAFLLFEKKELKEHFSPIQKDNPFWYEFINTELSTLLVLGDYFFMYEMHEGRRIFIRDDRINTLGEFESRIDSFEKERFPLDFTYMAPRIANTYLHLLPILRIGNQTIRTTYSSDLEWDDFDQSNVIYAGTYKSMFIIGKLLPEFNMQVELDSAYLLQRIDNDGNVIETYDLPRADYGNFRTDYSFIGKIKGPGNNTVLLIVSGDVYGLAEAISMITSPDFRYELEDLYDGASFEPPLYFKLILKSEGIREKRFNHEIVFFKEITYDP